MKKYTLIIAALLICASSFAQEWSAQTQEGKSGKKYNSYLTNNWNDNLFLGVAGGISTRYTAGPRSDIKTAYINPNIDVYILKWFTPCVGARLEYTGINGREGLNSFLPYQIAHSPLPYQQVGREDEFIYSSGYPGVLHYGSFNIHGDIMWNIINTYGGFRSDRVYTLSLYGSAGYLRIYDNKVNKGIGSPNHDNELQLGIGLFNSFKISERFMITADLRWDFHGSNYRTRTGVVTQVPSLTVGAAYNIFKTNWTDVKEVNATVNEALESAKIAEALMQETKKKNEELNKEIEELNRQIANLKNDDSVKLSPIEYADLKARAEKADLVVYYHINKATLNFSELFHIDSYVKDRLAQDPDAKFKITGSADKGTGNDKFNATLSLERALRVKALLMKEYGVKGDNITVDNVVTDKHAEGALDRCVMFER